jgi:hypothetical protein
MRPLGRRLLHPLVAASVLLVLGAAAAGWPLLHREPGTFLLVPALLIAGAAAGFANSGST